MTPRWSTLADLRALLAQYRAWEAKHDDVTVTAYIHGRSLPCAHGRDPWDRCDECEHYDQTEAWARARIAEVSRG